MKTARARSGRMTAWMAVALVLVLGLAPLAAIIAGQATETEPGKKRSGVTHSVRTELGNPRTVRALGFSLSQAAASSLVALAIGLPGAWFVARCSFPGRRFFNALSAVPFCMPPLLVILAFVLYYGRQGYLNRFLMGAFGLAEPPFDFLYSLWGIVLVHGFYNFPLVMQIVGKTWGGLPRDRADAARLLGAGRTRAFITGLLPSLAPAVAQATALVFLFSFFSFAIVMVFGGLIGSTLEVEVFRRSRLESDPMGAAAVAILETILALLVVIVIGLAEGRNATMRGAGGFPSREKPRGFATAALVCYACLILFFFLGPLIALGIEAFSMRAALSGRGQSGLGNFIRLTADGGDPLLGSLFATLATAIPAALIATALGSFVALALLGNGSSRVESRNDAGKVKRFLVGAPLAVSGIVTSLGWALLFPNGGWTLIALAQAFIALPFVIKAVHGALSSLESGPPDAARVLGATRFQVALTVVLPAAAPAVLAAAAFAFSIAAGDLNAAIVLGSGRFQSLTLLLYRLVSSYRFGEACAVGLVLGALTVAVFFIKEGRGADA
jgi:thiamine transport system permease protein